jgi:Flp pilus assembly protein TadB
MARPAEPRRGGRLRALADDVRRDPLPTLLLVLALAALVVLVLVIGSEVLIPVVIAAVVILTIASVSAERRRRGSHVRSRSPARVETFSPEEDRSGTDPSSALTSRPDRP